MKSQTHKDTQAQSSAESVTQTVIRSLDVALKRRHSFLSHDGTYCRPIRIYYGPADGDLPLAIDQFPIEGVKDRFGYWITQWKKWPAQEIDAICEFLKPKALQIGSLFRPEKGLPEPARLLYEAPSCEGDFFTTQEQLGNGDALRFRVTFSSQRHPGLFLDHAELRKWLFKQTQAKRILNLFSYTGSLSVAAAMGVYHREGICPETISVDLSKPIQAWARENWVLNGLPEESGSFLPYDTFEALKRFEKTQKKFDLIISDPPSFSRSDRGTFQTSKDLVSLHEKIFKILNPGGVVVTSINSAQLSREFFFEEVSKSAKAAKRTFQIVKEINLPEDFPTLISPQERYLKGFILKSLN